MAARPGHRRSRARRAATARRYSVRFLLGTGIAHALFDGATAPAREAAIGAVHDALGEFYIPGRGVVLGTGAWLVSAVRGR